MTTAAHTIPEVERLKADKQALGEENLALAGEVEDLRGQLADACILTPYDLPADVLAVLTILLPGWPAARWRELAGLIQRRTS